MSNKLSLVRHAVSCVARSGILRTARAPIAFRSPSTVLSRSFSTRDALDHEPSNACLSWQETFIPHSTTRSEYAAHELYDSSDTIFQLSSGLGTHSSVGVAIIRVSGKHSLDAFKALTGRKNAPKPRTATLCNLYRYSPPSSDSPASSSSSSPSSSPIDTNVLSLYFPGPRSFTGEDVVEFHCHGNRVVVHEILNALANLPSEWNMRLAEAGEFTRRAFDYGKIDLTQVEGLADLLTAETEQQRAQAVRQLEGHLGRLYEHWREELVSCLAYCEAVIDFAEDEADVGEQEILENVMPRVTSLQASIRSHLSDGRRGEIVRQGVSVAIVGAPNAGKSTLLNTLAQRDIAIVSNIPGTTRDVVECALNISGLPVLCADTAGLRETEDVVEAEGVRRAQIRVGKADLKIALFDAPAVYTTWKQLSSSPSSSSSYSSSSPLSALDPMTSALIDENTVVVFSKMDELGALFEASTSSSSSSSSSSSPSSSSSSSSSNPVVTAKIAAQQAEERQKQHLAFAQSQFQQLVAANSHWFNTSNNGSTNEVKDNDLHTSKNSKQSPSAVCFISCQVNSGVQDLLTVLTSQVDQRVGKSESGDPVISRVRHRTHLQECLQFLAEFEEHKARNDLVLAAEQLRQAARALGKIVGRVDVEQLLDVIFRDFCIGK